MKIAVIYADYGSGHKSVALNLKRILKDHEVNIYNAHREEHKYLTKFNEYVYNNLITKNASKRIVKDSYHISYKIVGKSKVLAHIFVKRLGYKFINDLIEGEELDLIIGTFPHYIADPKIKTLTIITDYTLDNTWYDQRTDYYFVASDEIKERLTAKKVNPEKIFVTGIPLHSKFDQPNNQKYVQKILFNLGARGQVGKKDLIRWTDYCLSKGLKVTIIAGKNKELYQMIRKRYENRVSVYGFVNKIPELLRDSDLVVTKAGGLSVSECLMSEKPMIINTDQSLKGQEKTNYDYIDTYDLGVLSKEKNLIEAIDYFLKSPQNYQQVVKNIQKIKVQNQEQKIIDIINQIKLEKK